jgi:PAS domain S-box-containing protein
LASLPDKTDLTAVAQDLSSLDVLDHITDAVALLDREWRYVYLNDRAAAMARVSRDQAQGRVIWDVHPGAAQMRTHEPLQRTMCDRVHTRFEEYYTPYDLWIEVDAYPSGDGILVLARDITVRKRAEERLIESERQARHSFADLETLYQTAPIGLAFLDTELRYRRANERLASIDGVQIQDLLGHTVHEVIPQAATTIAPLLLDVIRTGRPVRGREVQVATRAHGGQVRFYLVSYYPVLDNGIVTGVSAVVEDITAQKIAENALRESEKRYRTLFQTTGDGIVIVNDTGRYVEVNESYARILKTTKERLIGAHFSDFIPPERLKEAERAFTQLQAGSSKPIDFPLRAADGSIAELSWTSSSYYLPGLYFCVCRDIADRKRAENALRQREQESARVLAAIPDVITRFDRDLRVVYTSPAAERLTGIPFESYVGKTLAESGLPAPLIASFEAHLKQTIETGEARTIDVDFDSPSLGLRHLARTAIPEKSVVGRVDSVLTIVRDVTDLVASIAGQREARETAEQLNRIGPILLAELDLEKLVQSVTDIATKLAGAEFGAFFKDAAGRPYAISGRAEFPLARNAGLLVPTFRGMGLVRSDDLANDPRFAKPVDEAPVRSYLAIPVVSRSGEILGGLCFGHSAPGKFTEQEERLVAGIAAQAAIAIDNARLFEEAQWIQNELKRSNEDLRRANRDLEAFAYSASHDLQEPLRNVSIYSQLLQRRLGDHANEEIAKVVNGILNGVSRMQNLIRDLLAYSAAMKPAGGPAHLIDSAAILSTVLQAMHAQIEECGGSASAEPLPRVRMHEVHLSQLFQNLISNALKYRGTDPPQIRISASENEGWWIFSVADNGIGIDPRYRTQVFGLFKRLHSRDLYDGSGVGLSICQRIVEQYGGRIWVEGQESGSGSIFKFAIPAKTEG